MPRFVRFLFAAALLSAGVASAEVSLPAVDAFLESKATRALDLKALPKELRLLVESGRISSYESHLGVPTFFWPVRDGKGLAQLKLTPEQAARRYLFLYAPLYRSQPGALAESRLHRMHDTGTGAIVASFQHEVDGVRVFKDELRVVMNQKLELIALTGYLTPARKALGEFALGSDAAISDGVQQLTGAPLNGALTRLPNDEAGFERFQLGNQPTPVRVRRVYFPMPNGLEPAWHVELEWSVEGTTGSDYYAFVISARDGRLMFRKNLTQKDFSYRVWADDTGLKAPFDGPNGNAPTPHPQGTNNQYNPPFVAPNLVTLENAGLATNDPWLAAGATTTDGNNSVAYADFNSPNGFTNGSDLKATTTATGVFDRAYDPMQNPNVSPNQRMAAVTQLFYDVNFFHDYYYDVGFNEASGNAQKSNFGRGGAGNDPLLAEGQDYSGTDNANMSTPSDGASPRMQMYVFTSGTPASVAIQGGSTYRAGVADFGPSSFMLTGVMQLVNDGDATTGTLTDGCQANWTTPVTGKIAVIDRGLCTFAEKVQNAQNNGAIGAVILNNAQGGAIALPGTAPTVTIPALSMGRTDGTNLKARLNMAGNVTTATLNRSASLNRDGTIDNAIVAHEWGHYISNRLIDDGNGLNNNQGGGMGEGWGDFHSMLMAVKEEDAQAPGGANFDGTYGMAAYTTMASDPNGHYWGIRRYPYSTNLMKNPLTFKHIRNGVALPSGIPVAFGQSGASNAEVHNTGEVWAVMLWECYAALLRDSARLTFAQANTRMRSYLVTAYKATPGTPTFIDARDAVLAAAVANDPTDFALFSAAFAKRGLGMLAVAPDKGSETNSPLTESFVTGNAFQVVNVTLDDSVGGCDRDGHLDVGETGKLTVTIKNVGVGLLSATTGTVSTTAMGVNIAGGGALTFGNIAPFATGTATVDVTLAQVPGNMAAAFEISVTDPSTATPGPQRISEQFRVNFDAKSTGSINDDVEAPMTVWTFANNPNGNTGSDFRRYEDSGTSHWFYGPNPESPADTYLISPSLDVGPGPFSFTFSHRFQFEGDAMDWFDGGVVEISVAGGAWTDLGSKLSQPYNAQISQSNTNPLTGRMAYSGESPGYPAWSNVTVDLGTMYAGRSVRIRFRIGSDDALGLRGWEIDNLNFVGITNRPFPSVVSDPNLCTNNRPTVLAQPPRFVNENAVVKLTAVATDPDNEPLTVVFTQVAGPVVTMENGDTFTAPEVTADTALDFEVVASDGRATSLPVTQRIVVRNLNKMPIATVDPAELTVDEKADVTLNGTATDPDGNPIVGMRWVQRSGPVVGLTGADTATLTFKAPEVAIDSVLVFEVYARDADGEGAPGTATIRVRNLAEPITPVEPKPQGCGCASGNDGLTTWLAAAMAMFFVFARRRQR